MSDSPAMPVENRADCNNSLALLNWRLTFSHGNDLARGEVVEIPWIGRVVAWIVGIGIIIEH